MSSEVLDILVGARNSASDFDRWTYGSLGILPGARRGCAVGHVMKIGQHYDCDKLSQAHRALNAAGKTMGYSSAAALNDTEAALDPRGAHERVLQMFDLAIASVTPEPPQAGLAEPSVPLVVPAPNEEPRQVPVYPPAPPEPVPAAPEPEPSVAPEEAPVEEPVPA
jgi:hypothetical protein